MQKINVLMLDLKSYYSSPAFQLGLLAAYAGVDEEVSRNVRFVFTEHPREEPAEEIVRLILSSKFDLVAASNYAWNYKKICTVLNLLSQTSVKLPRIILGGPNSAGEFGTAMMKQYPMISAIVEGEGEPAFRDICCSLVDSPEKDPFQDARNCVIRTEEGRFARHNMSHRIQELDEIPSPYLTGLLPVSPAPVFYETNRGCPYRCSFCYWGNGNSKVYRMSTERIREEFEFFAKKNVFAFWIADANFGIFPADAEIAEIICKINSRYGRPFKNIGVNWAKNSSDRVLEIASRLQDGGIGCTTTLAIQSVTPEAEELSRRYSMGPSQFIHLIRSAHERNLDTYTDMIWGLPGENVEEYLDGLDSVISTGVPAIFARQLYLLPGTEFYDERQKFGLKIMKETDGQAPDLVERSDYWDYIVVSHPKMSREDMIRGTRITAINHVLHNHDLTRVVNFYLARYGISHRHIYEFFDTLILGGVKEFPETNAAFLKQLSDLVLTFANSVGLDENLFYRKLSDLIWYRWNGKSRESNEPVLRSFLNDFYLVLCRSYQICESTEEKAVLSDFIQYNVLISPKPTWKPLPYYTFRYDVHAMWEEMFEVILNNPLCVSHDSKNGSENWEDVTNNIASGLCQLLTGEYIAKKKGPVTYVVENPWRIPPSEKTSDWIVSNRSKHCRVSRAMH